MSSYKVENYDIFDSLVENNNDLSTELKDIDKVIDGQINNLKSDNYSGKFIDNYINCLSDLNKSIDKIVSDLTKMNKNLKELCENYKELDKKASQAASSNTSNDASNSGSNNTPNYIPKVTPSSKYSAYLNPQNVYDYRLDFINATRDKAIEMYDKYGLLPSVTMAHAITESGWGIRTEGNNLYNIRTSPDSGRMYVDDGYTGTYRSYNTIYDAMEDYGYFLTVEAKTRYAPLVAADTYQEAAEQIIKCGFGTDPNYPQKIVRLIEKYGLDQWDPK